MSGSAATVARPDAADVRRILAGDDDGRATFDFLTGSTDRLAEALTALLGDHARVRCELHRSRLKPGSKLQAYYTAHVADAAPRPVAVTWTEPGPDDAPRTTSGGPSAPFTSLRLHVPSLGTEVMVAPLDPAFDDLPRLYDEVHLAALLRVAGEPATADDVRVTPLRYRPGQRHVLRIDVASGRRLYAKCYRDDTGVRAVANARVLDAALAATDGATRVAAPFATVADGRVVLWSNVAGTPLSAVIATAPGLAMHAGRALRIIHDSARPARPMAARTDPRREATATVRAVRHIGALRPTTAGRLLELLHRAEQVLVAAPAAPVAVLHGDFKCDNVILGRDGSLTVLDFDRVTTGDPALDVGKFRADVRWWAMAAGAAAEPLLAAFEAGYGPSDDGRRERAAAYDVLYQLRAAGRRVPLHEPDWAATVDTCVEAAAGGGGR